jgi:hypothetical protein
MPAYRGFRPTDGNGDVIVATSHAIIPASGWERITPQIDTASFAYVPESASAHHEMQ